MFPVIKEIRKKCNENLLCQWLNQIMLLFFFAHKMLLNNDFIPLYFHTTKMPIYSRCEVGGCTKKGQIKQLKNLKKNVPSKKIMMPPNNHLVDYW